MCSTEKNISLCIVAALSLQSHGWLLPVWACHTWACHVGAVRGSAPAPGSSALAASASTDVLRGVTTATSAALCPRTHSLFWLSPRETIRHLQGIPGIPLSVGETNKGTAYMSSGNTPDNQEPRPEKKIGSGWSPLLGLEVLGSLLPSYFGKVWAHM